MKLFLTVIVIAGTFIIIITSDGTPYNCQITVEHNEKEYEEI